MMRFSRVPSVFAFIVALSFPVSVFAHEILPKSYVYDSIHIDIEVNKDSTFDVTEAQTYDFQGHFHKGWRSIPLKDIGTITDIAVLDTEGNPLVRSSRVLDKNDPASS